MPGLEDQSKGAYLHTTTYTHLVFGLDELKQCGVLIVGCLDNKTWTIHYYTFYIYTTMYINITTGKMQRLECAHGHIVKSH